ncbi:MAG: hypothetical protein O7E51_11810, partial [Acidobacteria bacterium]|nr:hypothetical protein [Acidobacteriota bacterium]
MKRPIGRVIRFLVVVAICFSATVLTWRHTRPASKPDLRAVPIEVPASVPVRVLIQQIVPILSGDTLADLLERAGIPQEARVELIAAVEKEFDLKKLRAGSQLALVRSGEGVLESLEYVIDPDNKLQVAKLNGVFVAQIAEVPGTIRSDAVCGTIQGSLFESME